MKSVYIHIPFCKSICSYCDFPKSLYNKEWIGKYLNALENETKEYYQNEKIKTIYIGGGTPSSLSIEELKVLFKILDIFDLEEIYEFTIELNVSDITEDLLKFLRTTKVNRISVGVESFNDINLKYLGRCHKKKDILDNFKLLKKYDFDNINIDIIYALPIENLSDVKYDIKCALKLGIHHISTYSLIIEENTYLSYKKAQSINEELDAKMYEYIVKTLKKNNFIHYEVSNFSLNGYESLHNLNYWNNNEYYGFGLGSHGYINGVRYENTRSLNKYLNKEYRLNELFVSKKEEMENEIILGLRKIEGINLKDFFKKFKCNIQDIFNIKELLKSGLLIVDKENLKIPESKIYIMNEILDKILR